MMWTDDPVRDAERYFAELDEKDKGFPLCSVCKEVVYDDALTDLYGNHYCKHCWDKND